MSEPQFKIEHVEHFADIEQEFMERVSRYVYASVASIDAHNRPRSRVLHPVWDGMQGWIGTFRQSPKANHLTHNPNLSLAYIGDSFKPVYVDCTARWLDNPADKQWFWEWVKTVPAPLGYDPDCCFKNDDTFGVLKLTPWRVEVYSLGVGTKIWHAKPQSAKA